MPKYITSDDIRGNDTLYKEITWQIQTWYADSSEYMEQKKELFKYRYSKFTNPAESESDKIKIHLLFQHLKAFISTYYTDWLSAWFVWQEFLDDDYAYMLETCFKKDCDTMNKKQKDFFHIFNIGFFGASLYMKDWYDDINDTIKYNIVSPEYWLPDRTWNLVKWFQYHMFDFSITDNEIKAINSESKTWDIYFDIDKYAKWLDWKIETDEDKKWVRALWVWWINTEYNWTRVFFIHKWVKYIADLFNNRTVIGRFERIMPVDEKEEKNPSLIPFPVEVVNCFPLENDPCGVWLAELVLSFQNAKNRLVNMSLRKEEWASWFQILLADISKITDIDLLAERPIDWPIIVPFNWEMWSLDGDVIRPVMDWIRSEQSTLNLASLLDQEAQINTWYTASQRWLPFWPDQSLWEAKMQQINSNLIFSLDSECISWWEVNFIKNMWLRWLKEFLPANKKKYARIGNGIASNDVMIDWNDIKEHNDPDIVVSSKKSINEKNKQKLDYMMAREALIMWSSTVPAISKLFFQRDIEKYRWIPREEIYLKFPRTSDENRAISYIKQLNGYAKFKWTEEQKKQLIPQALFKPWMDLWTYYIYLQKARASDLKDKTLKQIEMLMDKEWLNRAQQPMVWEQWADNSQVANSMSSQLTSNIAQQSGSVNNYPTRADVLNP